MYKGRSNHLDKITINRLMAGTVRLDIFDHISIEEITDNVRLKNIYLRSEVSSLSEFLGLGKKRLEIRNCGERTEDVLREALIRFLSRKTLHNLIFEEKPIANIEFSKNNGLSHKRNNSDIIKSLIKGSAKLDIFDNLTIQEITDNVRLINIYDRSGASNISEFLSLGEKRMKMRNCGRRTELVLRKSIEKFFSENPYHCITEERQPLDHDHLLRCIELTSKLRTSDWDVLREELLESDLSEYRISVIAAELGIDWPLSSKSPWSSKKISEFLNMPFAEILQLKSFGRKKLTSYLKCVVHLHNRLHDDDFIEKDLEIPERIQMILRHGRLTQREEEVIRYRFGIQEERKHTLSEIKDFYDVTRERVRQIQIKALKKLRMSRYFTSLPGLLVDNKSTIWQQLCNGEKLRKSEWMEPLEEKLEFEYQIALELIIERKNRNRRSSALAEWLDQHFPNDETFWYKNERALTEKIEGYEEMNPNLMNFLGQL